MSISKTELSKSIKEKRPQLSDSSLRTYSSLLFSLLKKLNEPSLEKLNVEKVKEHILSIEKPQSRKTLCSALFVATGEEEYRQLMLDDIKVVNDKYKEQKVEPTREIKPYSDILLIHHELINKLKKNPSAENYVNVIISYLSCGINPDLPPRRILDYALMKMTSSKSNDENFIEKGNFIFNIYKTSKRYGKQVVSIPKELITIINKWKKVNETDYLLVTEKGEPFTSSSLSRRVTTIFGVTMDALRSIYLSHIYKDIPKLSQMETTAYKMGHSVESALNYYVKKD